MTRSCVGPVSPSMRRNNSSDAAAPIAVGILGDHREARFHEVAQHHLIESDQGHASLQAQLAKRPERAHGQQVLAREQRRRRADPADPTAAPVTAATAASMDRRPWRTSRASSTMDASRSASR